MVRLNVHLTLPDGTRRLCGQLAATDPDARGRIQGAFRYAPEYLSLSDVFPLDPVHLPLTTREFNADRPEGVHGVFEDALPDDWGQRLLIRKTGLPLRDRTKPKLLQALGQGCMGALSFDSGDDTGPVSPAQMADLEELLVSALQYDAGEELDEERLQFLAIHGSSPGGARPKTLVCKEDGSLWLAKFPKHRVLLPGICRCDGLYPALQFPALQRSARFFPANGV